MRIVAYVQIRSAVSVKVSECHSQPPIIRRLCQGTTILIQKRTIGPRNGVKSTVPIIMKKKIRFAVFQWASLRTQRESSGEFRRADGHTIDLHYFPLAIHEVDRKPRS